MTKRGTKIKIGNEYHLKNCPEKKKALLESFYKLIMEWQVEIAYKIVKKDIDKEV